MKSYRVVWLLGVVALTGISFRAARTDTPAGGSDKPAFQYVGTAKCRRCHSSSKIGAQYRVWLESKHAHAFLSLASDSAKAFAAKKNVADPQHAPECLQCHVTGHGEPAASFATARADSEGVGCESCHGAGSGYWKQSTMVEIRSGKSSADKYGLVIPTKATCDKCHNEKSPAGTFVDWPADSAKIAHPIPKDYKIEAQ